MYCIVFKCINVAGSRATWDDQKKIKKSFYSKKAFKTINFFSTFQ